MPTAMDDVDDIAETVTELAVVVPVVVDEIPFPVTVMPTAMNDVDDIAETVIELVVVVPVVCPPVAAAVPG